MTVPGITVFGQQSHPDWTAGTPIAEDATGFPTDYVALDLETTGFYPNRCAITEIGAVRVRGGRVVAATHQPAMPDSSSNHRVDRHYRRDGRRP